MKLNLSLKFIMVISLLILTVSTFLGWFFIDHETQVIKNSLQERGQTLVKHFSRNCEYGLIFLYKDFLENIAQGVIQEKDVVYAIITHAKGETVIEKYQANKAVTIPDTIKNRALSNETLSFSLYRSGTSGEEIYDISMPVFIDKIESDESESGLFVDFLEKSNHLKKKDRIGTVQIGISLQNMHQTIRVMRFKLIMITLAVILVGVFVAIVMTLFITKPIKNLVVGTQAIARGDFDFKLKIRTGDEIEDLAHAFNKMTEDLSRTLVSKDQLEQAFSVTRTILQHITVGVIVVGLDKKI
ncbi:HAMP domain-containing protein, partial [candidate division CSSED10-310 bacterium]